MKRRFDIALTTWTALLATFIVHRWLSFHYLVPPGGLDKELTQRAMLVGALSDVWIACLAAIVAGLLGSWRWAVFTWIAFWILLAVGHQSYVEFFHFPIIPPHLTYLTDHSFLAANSATAVSFNNAVIIFVGVAVTAACERWKLFSKLSPPIAFALAATIAVGALYGHNRNIFYRVQWFIPENLQTNGIEHLFIRWQRMKPPDPLSDKELATLASALGVVPPPHHPPPRELFRLLSRPVGEDDAVAPVAVAMRQQFRAARAAGRKPVFAIVLLESERPSETGYFSPSKASLTPRLDQIAKDGMALMRVHSTGSVTRGGQEAVLCGYLGSRDTSLMRGTSLASIDCLPDLIARKTAPLSRGGTFFWYHGGEGRFDGQTDFWKLRHVGDLLALADFTHHEPRTGWGIGDETFFERSFERLAVFRRDTDAEYVAGMFLSVSNHIPWEMPEDAPSTIATNPNAAGHPSYLTTHYADHAFGEFIDRAKASGLWNDLILLAISDHGNNVPPRTELYGSSPFGAEEVQSHINFVISGGITERAVAETGRAETQPERERSQASAAALAAYILDLDGARFMGENPLGKETMLPVVSDLEEGVYFPAVGRYLPRNQLLDGSEHFNSPAASTAGLYYRAFLDFIQRPSGGSAGPL